MLCLRIVLPQLHYYVTSSTSSRATRRYAIPGFTMAENICSYTIENENGFGVIPKYINSLKKISNYCSVSGLFYRP